MLATRPGCSKLSKDNPRLVGHIHSEMKGEKTKFSLILFAYNVTIVYSKNYRENYSRKCFRTLKTKKLGLKLTSC